MYDTAENEHKDQYNDSGERINTRQFAGLLLRIDEKELKTKRTR